jgi:hypothetical protein
VIPSGLEIFEMKPAMHVTQEMRSTVRAYRNSSGLRSATKRTARFYIGVNNSLIAVDNILTYLPVGRKNNSLHSL